MERKYMGITRRSLLIGTPLGSLLLWLALSKSQTNRRIQAINREICAGNIGRLQAPVQSRLEEQVRWIARNADIREEIAVNSIIVPGRLTVITTRPDFKPLTNCGLGNAIYDSEMDVIFIDDSLLLPYDLTLLGDNGAFSMVDVTSLGFVTSHINFILAHELGHRHNRCRSLGFFTYGPSTPDSAGMGEEIAADRFAIDTIAKGYRAGALPEAIRRFNAMDCLGLSASSLAPDELAVADVMGSMVTMAKCLLFSSSPYSPYFFDDKHPDFLRRAADAITASDVGSESKSLQIRNAVVVAELTRMRDISEWVHRELAFPEAVYELAIDGDELWAGCYGLPRPDQLVPTAGPVLIPEHLLRLSLPNILSERSLSQQPLAFQTVASGVSDDKSLPGTWLDQQFRSGRAQLGAFPSPSTWQAERVKTYKDGHHSYSGFDFAGYMWRWHDAVLGQVGVLEATLDDVVTNTLGERVTRVGVPQKISDGVAIPVAVNTRDRRSGFRVVVLNQPVLENTLGEAMYVLQGENANEESYEFAIVDQTRVLGSTQFSTSGGNNLAVTDGEILVSGVRFWQGHWWIPVHVRGNGSERWAVWRAKPGEEAVLHVQGALFPNLRRGNDVPATSGDEEPLAVQVLLVERGPLILGFEHDSIYAVSTVEHRFITIFHPMIPGLRMLNIGNGWVLFWIRNGSKAYAIDALRGKKRA